MTLDKLLSWGQEAPNIVGAPWGTMIGSVSGTVRGNLGRIEGDIPAIAALAKDAGPVLDKHLPALMAFWKDIKPVLDARLAPALASSNDIMPIVSLIAAQISAAFPVKSA